MLLNAQIMLACFAIFPMKIAFLGEYSAELIIIPALIVVLIINNKNILYDRRDIYILFYIFVFSIIIFLLGFQYQYIGDLYFIKIPYNMISAFVVYTALKDHLSENKTHVILLSVFFIASAYTSILIITNGSDKFLLADSGLNANAIVNNLTLGFAICLFVFERRYYSIPMFFAFLVVFYLSYATSSRQNFIAATLGIFLLLSLRAKLALAGILGVVFALSRILSISIVDDSFVHYMEKAARVATGQLESTRLQWILDIASKATLLPFYSYPVDNTFLTLFSQVGILGCILVIHLGHVVVRSIYYSTAAFSILLIIMMLQDIHDQLSFWFLMFFGLFGFRKAGYVTR